MNQLQRVFAIEVLAEAIQPMFNLTVGETALVMVELAGEANAYQALVNVAREFAPAKRTGIHGVERVTSPADPLREYIYLHRNDRAKQTLGFDTGTGLYLLEAPDDWLEKREAESAEAKRDAELALTDRESALIRKWQEDPEVTAKRDRLLLEMMEGMLESGDGAEKPAE